MRTATLTKFAARTVAAWILMMGVAGAADLGARFNKAPAATVPSWTGFYIGVNGGGAFGSTSTSHTGLPADSVVAAGDYNLGHNLSGGFGGAQIGYNWQFSQSWLFGVEADVQGGDIRGSGTLAGVAVAVRNGTGGLPGNFVTATEKIDSFGTIRARLGALVTPNVLFYGTGGAAWGTVSTSGQLRFAPAIDYIGSSSDTRWGYAVGAGIEWKFAPNWSLKGEYLYVDLGNHSLVTTQNPNPAYQSLFDFNTHFSVARVGLNYQFGGPVTAKY